MSDLKLAFDAITRKRALYGMAWAYYDGKAPLRYSTEGLARLFKSINVRYNENWAAVVVDAVWERIALQRFAVAGSEEASERLNALWKSTEMHLDSDEAHLAALVCGEAFLIAWKDGEETSAYYNPPELCHVQYDPERPRHKLWAAKMWDEDEGKRHITIYYPDRLDYYVSKGKAANVSSHAAFVLAESAPNPFGVVPVFHMRLARTRQSSELDNVLGPQDAVNKLIADMMASSEAAAFRQRYVVTRADLSGLRSAPGEIWEIPAGDQMGESTQVGEFNEADLSPFLAAIEQRVKSIGAITRTPKHYFLQQGGDPSGEALIAMEAPLVKKCARHIERFRVTMQRFAAWLLGLDGHAVDMMQIQAIYADPATVQPLTASLIRQNNVATGIPLATQLRDEGRDEAYLAAMEEDRAAEAAAAQRGLADAMIEAQRGFDGA